MSGSSNWNPSGSLTPLVASDNETLVTNQFPNNRWMGPQYPATYDAAGNFTSRLGNSYNYDEENRLVSATVNGVASSYGYDGLGRRVTSTANGVTTVYVYGPLGDLVAEYRTNPPSAPPQANVTGTFYPGVDQLGSTRVLVDSDGYARTRLDYLPFGERISSGTNSRPVEHGNNAARMLFAGKERDAETGLDYFGARYFSSAQGRFTSPDPFNILMEAEDRDEFNAYISNPQNWNRYVYTWNNPLRYVDPDGERVYVVAYTTGNSEGDEEFKKVAETLARQIQNSKGFDAKKDTVVVRGVGSKDDFKSLIVDANKLEKQFGKVEGVSLVSHGGPADGPIFARPDASGNRQFMGGERELGGLTINWAQSGEARFYGCNTAVAFCQRFSNAQGVPSWGFNTYSSFSGDPNSKSKWYLLNPWNRDLYMIGRDGSGMVRRNPTRPRR